MSFSVAVLGAAATVTMAFNMPAASDDRQRAGGEPYPAMPPRYELDLTNLELSVFNAAIQTGVLEAGGEAKLNLTLRRTPTRELRWTLTIQSEVERHAWEYWIERQATEGLATESLAASDVDAQRVLAAVRSAATKIKASKDTPVYDTTTVAGTIESVSSVGDVMVRGERGLLRVIRPEGFQATGLIGVPVVATGSMVAAATLKPIRMVDVHPRLLELAVMSHCPFGRSAQAAVIRAARERPYGLGGVRLHCRYIFKELRSERGSTFSALHGDVEFEENVVQIILRDEFTAHYEDYVLARVTANPTASQDQDRSWTEVAREVGLSEADVSKVKETVRTRGNQIVAAEVAEIRDRYGEINASPTFIYESMVLPGPEGVPGLESLDLGTGSCGK